MAQQPQTKTNKTPGVSQAHKSDRRKRSEKKRDPRDAGKPIAAQRQGVDSGALVEKFIAAVADAKLKGADLSGMQVHLHIHQNSEDNDVTVEAKKKGFRGLLQKTDRLLTQFNKRVKGPTAVLATGVLALALNVFGPSDPANASESDKTDGKNKVTETFKDGANKVFNKTVERTWGEIPALISETTIAVISDLRGKPAVDSAVNAKDAVINRRDDAAVVRRESELNAQVARQGVNVSAPPAAKPAATKPLAARTSGL